MSSIRRVIATSYATKYTTAVIHFFSIVVISRLLTPEEIGVYSVGAAFLGIIHSLRDFGVTNYLIQEVELTKQRIATAFTLTLTAGFCIGTLMLFAAPYLAEFYDDERVQMVLSVIAINLFLIPFGSVSLTLLHRDLKFKSIYWVSVSGALAHVLTGITLAWLGYGFMSLAWAALAGVLATVIGSYIAAPQYFVTRLSISERRRVFGRGTQFGAISLSGSLATSAPDLIISKLLGFAEVGIFNRGLGYVKLTEQTFLRGLKPVLLPYFSKKNRDGAGLNSSYLLAVEHLSGVAWPLFGLMGLCAGPMILILFGDQWGAAVPIAQLLCIAMALKVFSTLSHSSLMASGGLRNLMLVTFTIHAVKIALIFWGATHGLLEAAFGYLLGELIGALCLLLLGRYRLRTSTVRLGMGVFRSVLVTIAALLPGSLIILTTGLPVEVSLVVIGKLLLIAVTGGVLWLVTIYIVRHSLLEEVSRGVVLMRKSYLKASAG